jgi:hypothetical protein
MVIFKRNKSTTDCREIKRPALEMKENQQEKREEGIQKYREGRR